MPIGQLALEEGILSGLNIFDILRAQHRSPHVRFGELALEMGLMNRDDLMRLLMIQADRRVPIEEILVRKGVLTKSQADEVSRRIAGRRPIRIARRRHDLSGRLTSARWTANIDADATI